MELLAGKVAIVTGAGRGIGRAEACALAAAGAAVVVNDGGSSVRGDGRNDEPARSVVGDIEHRGGRAVANTNDCGDWDGAAALVECALEHFGRLDVLVNNAGILRRAMSYDMTEADWDAVVRVHLKGHFAMSHFAARYWHEQQSRGEPVDACIVNTSSESGLFGNAGGVNYVAAKAGIAGMTIALARELAPLGVRVNAIAPRATTRMTFAALGIPEPGPDGVGGAPDLGDPAHVPPVVVWLASDAARGITGQLFLTYGGRVALLKGWHTVAELPGDGPWSAEGLVARGAELFRDQGSTPEPLPFATPRASTPS